METLSNCASNFNLRHYTTAAPAGPNGEGGGGGGGGGSDGPGPGHAPVAKHGRAECMPRHPARHSPLESDRRFIQFDS